MTRTSEAMGKLKQAHDERTRHPGCNLAGMYERQADELLVLDQQPVVGPGGEVVPAQAPGATVKSLMIRETLTDGADAIAADASARRTDLLMMPSFNAVATGLDAANAIGAANSLEKMLAHQMAVTHEAAIRLMDRALSYEADGRNMGRPGDSTEACRLVNASARMMSAFQDGLMTLQRLRSGGTQTVTVQHVNVVQAGGQAMIGNVTTGGGGGGGRKRRPK